MMSKEQVEKMKLDLLSKKIATLHGLLDRIEKLQDVGDKLQFLQLIGGIIVFLETNLDPEFK